MDELQDAIEDANYVSAMVYAENKGPRPVVTWKLPTESQLEEWKEMKNEQLAKDLLPQPQQALHQQPTSKELQSLFHTTTKVLLLPLQEDQDHPITSTSSSITTTTAITKTQHPKEEEKEEEGSPKTNTTILADSTTTRTTVSNSAATSGHLLVDTSRLRDLTVGKPPLQDYEYICSQPLGFFLFAQYVKDVRQDYVRMNFVEDVAIYKKKARQQPNVLLPSSVLQDKAREIANSYFIHRHAILQQKHTNSSTLLPTPAAGVTSTVYSEAESSVVLNRDREVLVLKGPSDRYLRQLPKKDIVDLDIYRPIPTTVNHKTLLSLYSNTHTSAMNHGVDVTEQLIIIIEKLLRENLDYTYSVCPIGIGNGEILRHALTNCGLPTTDLISSTTQFNTSITATTTTSPTVSTNINETTPNNDTAMLSSTTNATVDLANIFDLIEFIVMEGLILEYWEDFLTKSTEYRRLLNFWWFRDCPVVEEDFYLIRVLGRGGFGLVHGRVTLLD